MAVITRRYGKALKLSLFFLVVCVVFLFTSEYMEDSVSEYRDYLRNSLAKAKGTDLKESSQDTGNGDHSMEPTAEDNGKILAQKASETSQKLKNFYEEVFRFIEAYSPQGATAKKYRKACRLKGDIGFRPENYAEWSALTEESLSNCLEVSREEASMLKQSHASYVDAVSTLVLPKDSYKGKGIVTVGGGRFSIMALLIIKTLRKLNTQLPVEVFIPPNDEGETDFCENVLPKLNAKCIHLSDTLPKSTLDSFEFNGYQFKSLSLISSSFEDVLFLDADNFPVKSLNHIFDQEPYKSTGFVLWPDYWRRTTQPIYYDIADIPITKKRTRNCFDDLTPTQVYTRNINDLSDIPFHDLAGTIPDVSTESGQLMINKSTHLPTILLALYYNVNGPKWFYPMFSQKAAGEGDKETFLAAATFYGLHFYQVKTVVGAEGYHQPNNEGFRGVAMLQHDFSQDYQLYQKAAKAILTKYGSSGRISYDKKYSLDAFYKTYFDGDLVDRADVMFAHSNAPKFEPYGLWKGNELVYDGKHVRSFTALKKINNYDIELENFREMDTEICKNRIKFKYLIESLKDEKEWKSMCAYVSERLLFLESTHQEAIGSGTSQ
ncbi:hypothetical protein HG535_0C02500 [Zygotorulaspora mrakii]|uniref:Alpha-1,2-mannosyltransferase MNN2 n=1 Tax=Zygotorulaspora mrakii TaxID=42260 RepID=A0A7H9AZV4_ZYGMR|nr:uncharacterized protein HG535_0C02500 [Zygotorulaspora mrakii]QLG71898.1 hypothetical protein HG535_0C02500 [Zygotorulaspora mrakii]